MLFLIPIAIASAASLVAALMSETPHNNGVKLVGEITQEDGTTTAFERHIDENTEVVKLIITEDKDSDISVVVRETETEEVPIYDQVPEGLPMDEEKETAQSEEVAVLVTTDISND